MNRTSALVLTAVVSASMGGAAVWFVVRPSPPLYVGLEAPTNAVLRPVVYRTESENESEPKRARQGYRGGSQAARTDAEVASATFPSGSAEQSASEGESRKLTLEIKRPRVLHMSSIQKDQDKAASTAEQVDVDALERATLLDQVVVPIPSEVFGRVPNLIYKEWEAVVKPTGKSRAASVRPEETALRLGTLIADGFIAVHARKFDEVEKIGRNLELLAIALGAEDTSRRRRNSIVTAARARDGKQICRELDTIVPEIREANNDTTAHLVSLGTWLRSTEALTAMISKEYSKDAAELLHQPAIIEHFHAVLSGLPRDERTEIITVIYRSLTEMRSLMGSDAQLLSLRDVRAINHAAEVLVSRIEAVSTPAERPISLR